MTNTESAESIPQVIMGIPGAWTQIQSHAQSESATSLLAIAATYQDECSLSRLARPRAQNASLQKAMSTRISKIGTTTNATKALLADIKAAPEIHKKMKIVASLWLNKKTKCNSMKFTSVHQTSLFFNSAEEEIRNHLTKAIVRYHRSLQPDARCMFEDSPNWKS